MDFSAIIKRSWQITWRYKALWVLGIFAGVSGCSSGGGGGGNSGGRGGGSSSGMGDRFDSLPDLGRQADRLATYLPVIAAGAAALLVLWIVWSVLGIAARGGLVRAVNDIEDGREVRLGELWSAGFSRWWSLFGMGLLLKLPVFIGIVALLALIIIPLIPLIQRGGEPSFESFLPMLGSLCIGLPILVVAGLLLDLLYLVGLRYVMLGGQGAIDGIRSAWGFIRARFKDSFLMYLLNGVLNIVAGIVLVIPMAIIIAAMIVPTVMGARSENWSVVFGSVGAGIIVVMILSTLFNGVWGTFTSSLWTLLFRSATGIAAVAPATGPLPVRPAPEYAPPAPPAPQAPGTSAEWTPAPPPAPPSNPPTPPAPPIEGYPTAEPPAAPADVLPEPPAEHSADAQPAAPTDEHPPA